MCFEHLHVGYRKRKSTSIFTCIQLRVNIDIFAVNVFANTNFAKNKLLQQIRQHLIAYHMIANSLCASIAWLSEEATASSASKVVVTPMCIPTTVAAE